MPATIIETGTLIRTGQTTAVVLLERCLDAIARLDDTLNAFISVTQVRSSHRSSSRTRLRPRYLSADTAARGGSGAREKARRPRRADPAHPPDTGSTAGHPRGRPGRRAEGTSNGDAPPDAAVQPDLAPRDLNPVRRTARGTSGTDGAAARAGVAARTTDPGG